MDFAGEVGWGKAVIVIEVLCVDTVRTVDVGRLTRGKARQALESKCSHLLLTSR